MAPVARDLIDPRQTWVRPIDAIAVSGLVLGLLSIFAVCVLAYVSRCAERPRRRPLTRRQVGSIARTPSTALNWLPMRDDCTSMTRIIRLIVTCLSDTSGISGQTRVE